MGIAGIILIIVGAVIILALLNLINRTPPKGIDKPYFQNEWNDILKMVEDPKTRPLSIIHADKLLDEALKCCGFHGDTMGERLVSAKKSLSNRDSVWGAHKLRNRLVHEKFAEPSERDAKTALKGYSQAFRDLRVF